MNRLHENVVKNTTHFQIYNIMYNTFQKNGSFQTLIFFRLMLKVFSVFWTWSSKEMLWVWASFKTIPYDKNSVHPSLYPVTSLQLGLGYTAFTFLFTQSSHLRQGLFMLQEILKLKKLYVLSVVNLEGGFEGFKPFKMYFWWWITIFWKFIKN